MSSRPRLGPARTIANRVVNPVVRPLAGRIPGLALVTHVGRWTGRTHDTPMAAFRHADAWVFALTYGSDVDWVQNVLTAGSCVLTVRGRSVRLVEPEVVVDPSRGLMPPPVRVALRVLRVSEFLRMRPD